MCKGPVVARGIDLTSFMPLFKSPLVEGLFPDPSLSKVCSLILYNFLPCFSLVLDHQHNILFTSLVSCIVFLEWKLQEEGR